MGRLHFTHLLNGWMNAEETARFHKADEKIAGGKFQVRDDLQSLTQIVAVFRQFKAANPDFELGLVDHLQLIDADKGGRDDTREQVISHISRAMRRLASELNIAILMLVQLNEDGQVRERRAPSMDCTAHIRIEPEDKDGNKCARIVYQRNGPSNVGIPLTHLGQFLRFEEAD
jgi:replicative DNA helicase